MRKSKKSGHRAAKKGRGQSITGNRERVTLKALHRKPLSIAMCNTVIKGLTGLGVVDVALTPRPEQVAVAFVIAAAVAGYGLLCLLLVPWWHSAAG